MQILPVFIPSLGCPYQCVYCDQQAITNTSDIDLHKISNDIKKFCNINQDNYKEIAFYGGTFTNLPKEVRERLLSITTPYLNEKVGLRISTRPDKIELQQLQELARKGLRTVELGIQSFSDIVLNLSDRVYTKKNALNACDLVRSTELNLGIQLMPGLPGSNHQSLKETLKTVISVNPDFVRIYPTVVLKDTVLEKLFLENKYNPLTLKEAIAISAELKSIFENHDIKVIKTGLHSDIDPENIVAGPYHQSFGELVRIEMILKKIIANYQPEQSFVISNKDVSLFKGFKQDLIKRIKRTYKIKTIPVIVNPHLQKGEVKFTDKQAQLRW